MSAGQDGHVHLAVVSSSTKKPAWDWARYVVVALGIAAIALFGLSFTKSWWSFVLYAPQYPNGLRLDISLTGMGGDVHEIDLLNHYIGMKHLTDAAPLERHIAGYGVGAVCVIVIVALTVAGRRLNKVVAIPAVSFPLLFLADSLYWLTTFGHDLDPHAPLHINAFTPQLFGNGKIGQFETFATPSIGFYLACLGVVCAVASTFFRSKVCANCKQAGTCKTVCHRLMVLPDHEKEGTS